MPNSLRPSSIFSRSRTSTAFFCWVLACVSCFVVVVDPFTVPISSTMSSCSMSACSTSCNKAKKKARESIPTSTTPRPSFYQRKLPDTCVAFASQEGKKIFKSALENNGLKSFYNLIEQHHTQTEPAFCGVSTRTSSPKRMEFNIEISELRYFFSAHFSLECPVLRFIVFWYCVYSLRLKNDFVLDWKHWHHWRRLYPLDCELTTTPNF